MASSSLPTKAVLVAVGLLVLTGSCAAVVGNTCAASTGLFTDYPTSCWEHDCFLEFCSCVDGSLTPTCAPFASNLTASQMDQCAARRVTCILNAALNAPLSQSYECRQWGLQLQRVYAAYYADRSSTSNLTTSCEADMCNVVYAGAPSITSSVNLTYVCSLVNFTFPAPLLPGEIPYCALPASNYFDLGNGVPGICTATCMENFCTCVNGTWNATVYDCKPGNLTPDLAKTCFAQTMDCVINTAIDTYVPGASPVDPNPCVAWSVGIARDLSMTDPKNLTDSPLWQTCNATACNVIFGNFLDNNFSRVCDFTTVNFTTVPYVDNSCPMLCPDYVMCAVDLKSCDCVSGAAITSLDVLFALTPNGTLDASIGIDAFAYATFFGVGNCSTADLSSYLSFNWELKSGNVVVDAINTSSVYFFSNFTVGSQYTLFLTAVGPAQSSSLNWTFTAVAPDPFVSITEFGAEASISNLDNYVIYTDIVDFSTTARTASWTCAVVSSNFSCPQLNATSVDSATIIANASISGVFDITFTYRGLFSDVLRVTIVNASIPLVKISVVNTPLTTSPLAFLSSQVVILSSIVTYDSTAPLEFAWSINGGAEVSGHTLFLQSKNLTSSTLASIASKTFTVNNISLLVTDSSTGASGFSQIRVVVVADFTLGLTVAVQNSVATSAAALTDTLVFTPSGGPAGPGDSPFGALVSYTVVYEEHVGSSVAALQLPTNPAGSSFTGKAPMYASNATSKNVTFGIILRLNGFVAATGVKNFSITLPDLSAATQQQLSLVDNVQGSDNAVNLASTISNLAAAASGNATLVAELSKAALKVLTNSVTNAASLTSSQQLSLVSAITSSVSQSGGVDVNATAKIANLLDGCINSANFDPSSAGMFLGAATGLDASAASSTSVTLALKLSGDKNSPIDEVKSVSAGNVTVVYVRKSGANVSGASMSAGNGAGISLPVGLSSIPGISATDTFGIASSTIGDASFGNGTTQPSGGAVTFDFTTKNGRVPVSGLSQKIRIDLPKTATGGTCGYIDTAAGGSWTLNLETHHNHDGSISCSTDHLTAFGSFAVVTNAPTPPTPTTPSSASSVALSVLVVVLAAMLQLIMS